MRCYELTTVPFPATPSVDCRFCLRAANPISAIKPKPIRIGVGSLRVRVRVRAKAASVDDGFVGLELEASEMSFYELLGVPESGSLVEVKQAYKQLALKYHPDVSPPDRVEEYTKRFIMVQEAYETLSDPSRRAIYDDHRHIPTALHFAFSARRPHCVYHDQVIEQKKEWKSRWQSQLSELKRRNKCKDGGGNMSWAARMREQRDGLSNEL